MTDLAVGIILGVLGTWLVGERVVLWRHVRALEASSTNEGQVMANRVADLSERLEAVENPVLRMASEAGERAKIAAKLKLQPRYKDMDDARFDAAVDQIMGSLHAQRPKERA